MNNMRFKSILVAFAIALPVVLSSCGGHNSNSGEKKEKAEVATVESGQVNVLYLHGTNRCPSCNAIEAATIKTVENFFKNEVENNTLTLRCLNVEEKANQALGQKYEAFGPTLLVIHLDEEGQEVVNDLTGDGFRFAMRDEARFISGLKLAIEDAMKK